MTKLRAVFLMSEQSGRAAHTLAVEAGLDLESITVDCLEDLERAFIQPQDILLSFSTGVIVPKHILCLPGLLSLNVHGASPNFPGRDPHHFAIYEQAKEYGATMHFMEEKVDQGPIVDVELFSVPDGATPANLLARANAAGIELIRRFFANYAASGAPAVQSDISWGQRKSTRRLFLDLCRVDCSMSESEFRRRLVATTMPGYNNLYIDIHGFRFRLEGEVE